jgi:hypothetical protein
MASVHFPTFSVITCVRRILSAFGAGNFRSVLDSPHSLSTVRRREKLAISENYFSDFISKIEMLVLIVIRQFAQRFLIADHQS